MRYEIELVAAARDQLRAMRREARYAIGSKLNRLQDGLSGDVKKLKGFRNKYRLRVGDYRVLFELERACIVVYSVGHRKDIYE